jgi:putative exosortase-associated protein (TIGR04073 family)
MKRINKVWCSALIFLSCLFYANSAEPENSHDQFEGVPAETIVDAMSRKFFRGAANILTGWVELPRQVALTGSSDGPLAGVTLGIFKGIFMTVIRTAVGGVEAVTFISASPGSFDQILDPGLVWEQRRQDVALSSDL